MSRGRRLADEPHIFDSGQFGQDAEVSLFSSSYDAKAGHSVYRVAPGFGHLHLDFTQVVLRQNHRRREDHAEENGHAAGEDRSSSHW